MVYLNQISQLLFVSQFPIKVENILFLALGLGDYKKIVKKPIDLNQIRRQNN